jgi:transposase
MRPRGTPQQLYERRREAVRQVIERKRPQAEVARAIGVHPATLCGWVRLYRDGGGAAALRVKRPPGRPPGLDEAQVADVVECVVVRGAKGCGFDTDLWTLPRIARLIERRHGVRYDVDHLSRLVRSWGLSWQKPATRPVERDEAAIDRWLKRDWPRVKKKSRG